MNDLRLALLVIGVLILVLIYLYGQWEARRKGIRDQKAQHRPLLKRNISGEEREAPGVQSEQSQETRVPTIEAQPSPSTRTVEAHQRPREEEEEFLEDLDGLATLVEEAKDHYPEKPPERTETMSSDKAKKSRFALPKKWLRTKTKPEPEESEPAPQSNKEPEAAPQPKEPPEPELLIVLTVVGQGKQLFQGKDIVQILEEKGLQYGEMNIYHAHSPGGRPIFSVANLVEPGTFDLERLDEFTTPGLTLFLRLPGPAGGFAAFDAMLETAQMLAEKLDGEIRDERRNVLTTQAIQQTRERILTFNRTRRTMGV